MWQNRSNPAQRSGGLTDAATKSNSKQHGQHIIEIFSSIQFPKPRCTRTPASRTLRTISSAEGAPSETLHQRTNNKKSHHGLDDETLRIPHQQLPIYYTVTDKQATSADGNATTRQPVNLATQFCTWFQHQRTNQKQNQGSSTESGWAETQQPVYPSSEQQARLFEHEQSDDK